MKKYFVTETDEICNFGEVLHLTMFKELEDGKVTVEKDVEFNEDTMDLMIEMGFIEEREVEESENDLLDFDCLHEDLLQEIYKDQKAQEKRIEVLEEQVKVLKTLIDDLVKKNAQSKKK